MQDPDAQAQQIFTELMSPFCPGLTLADCPSPNAFDLRTEIRRRLDAGEPLESIRAELVQKYGVEILADPTGTPIGTVIWGVPAGVAAVAAVGLAWFVRRATRVAQAEGPAAQAAAADTATARRLDEELAEMD
jgi:cytochrome c-type biogenesis protein CcmH